MSSQVEGLIGKQVDRMIRRSVRKAFHTVHVRGLHKLPPGPKIFPTTHHGWHDGYLMYHAMTAINEPILDWITEFDAFPLFAKIGGMPFPANDQSRRSVTIRETIRRMKSGERSLLIFPESHLHIGPEILPLGSAIELIYRKVPGTVVYPSGIVYELAMHERPEAYVQIGDAWKPETLDLDELRSRMENLLVDIRRDRGDESQWQTLVAGTLDVNERWDFRTRFGRKNQPSP